MEDQRIVGVAYPADHTLDPAESAEQLLAGAASSVTGDFGFPQGPFDVLQVTGFVEDAAQDVVDLVTGLACRALVPVEVGAGEARGVKTGIASSVRAAQWAAAEIYPDATNPAPPVSPAQAELLKLFVSPQDP